MKVRAEIECLNCGRFLGELEGDRERSYKNAQVIYPAGAREIVRSTAGLQCGYCGGKAIVQYLERVRQAA